MPISSHSDRPSYKTPRVLISHLSSRFESGATATRVLDITHLVVSLDFGSGIIPPWQSCSIKLVENAMSSGYRKDAIVPDWRPPDRSDLKQKKRLRSGFQHTFPMWVSIRDEKRGVIWGGYVDDITTTGEVVGQRPQQVYTSIQAIGFMDLAMRANVGIIPKIQERAPDLTHGTFWDVGQWKQIATNAARDALSVGAGNDMGVALSNFWKATARIRMPKAVLQSGNYLRPYLGEQITVVHSPATARTAGYRNACPNVPGTYIGNILQTTLFGGNLGGMIRNTFLPDDTMVELFPVTHGSKAVLVYRMKPLRTLKALQYQKTGKYTREGGKQQHQQPGQSIPGGAAVSFDVPTHFGDPSWTKLRVNRVNPHELISYSFRMSDSRGVNVVTAAPMQHGDAQTFYMGLAGLPVRNAFDVVFMGGRVYRPMWPFVPPVEKNIPPGEPNRVIKEQYNLLLQNYANWLRAVAYEAAQLTLGRHRYIYGNLTCLYRPDIRHGEKLYLQNVEEIGVHDFGTVAHSGGRQVDVEFGETTITGGKAKMKIGYEKGRTAVGYITKVTHSLAANPTGSISRTTSISFDYLLMPSLEYNRTHPIFKDAYDEVFNMQTDVNETGTSARTEEE